MIENVFHLQILQALETETTPSSTAAQCVSSVAILEFSVDEWKQCIPTLVDKVFGNNTTNRSRKSTIEAIGT